MPVQIQRNEHCMYKPQNWLATESYQLVDMALCVELIAALKCCLSGMSIRWIQCAEHFSCGWQQMFAQQMNKISKDSIDERNEDISIVKQMRTSWQKYKHT